VNKPTNQNKTQTKRENIMQSKELNAYLVRHVAKGNKKLPKSTRIFNSGSATECPSRKLGLCQCPDKCYAMKAERQYPNVKPYRERQREITLDIVPEVFAFALLDHSDNCKHKMQAFRFNEAGDFESQEQISWFVRVCSILYVHGVKCYGYTARTDLDLSQLLKVSVVNVSNDCGHWIERGANRFIAVDRYTGTRPACAGDCRKCKLCLVKPRGPGRTVEVEMH
jgi:hypothetical protein